MHTVRIDLCFPLTSSPRSDVRTISGLPTYGMLLGTEVVEQYRRPRFHATTRALVAA